MNALYLLVGISLIVALGFLGAFLWAMKTGQFDDDYTPSVRMLFENPPSSEAIVKKSPFKEDTFCNTYKNNKQQNNK